MHIKHKFALNYIIFRAQTFCVLNDDFAVFCIHKIRDISALALKQLALFHPASRADLARLALGRDKYKFDLPPEICNLSGLLQQLQLLVSAELFPAVEGHAVAGNFSVVILSSQRSSPDPDRARKPLRQSPFLPFLHPSE